MWRQSIFILPLVLLASAIKVPVDKEQSATEIIPVNKDPGQQTNVFYISDDVGVDSYLIPPNPHKPEEASLDTPATFLVPPAQDRQSEYFIPTEVGAQSDWLPIQAQNLPEIPLQRQPKAVPIFPTLNYSVDKLKANIIDVNRFIPPVPSTHLEPPSVDAVNEFIITSPEEIELPTGNNNQEILQPYKLTYTDIDGNVPIDVEPTLALHLVPPKPQVLRGPTKLYPKKYSGGFKPLPIPIAQFAEDDLSELSKTNLPKYYKPLPIAETQELPLSDEKTLYHYKKAEHQRKLKGEDGQIQPHQLADGATQETYGGPTSNEQETSETNFRYPGQDTYSAPLREAPAPAPLQDPASAPAPDGRTEFRMHGMKGPHSYQFGYDTGKGKNRQFRYEERDNDGLVRGHYGYMDKNGKMRVVNYSAHPEYGFRAEEPQEKL